VTELGTSVCSNWSRKFARAETSHWKNNVITCTSSTSYFSNRKTLETNYTHTCISL